MARLPASYKDIVGLEALDDSDLNTIEIKASVLSLAECYEFLTVDVADLSEEDKAIAHKVWTKGRLDSIHKAGAKLFQQMEYKNGADAALSYLKQMSVTFKEENISSGSGFSFNVTLDE